MYDEPNHVPKPDAVIFPRGLETRRALSAAEPSGTWAKGKVFYFRPGHETHAVYTEPLPMTIVGKRREMAGIGHSREEVASSFQLPSRGTPPVTP